VLRLLSALDEQSQLCRMTVKTNQLSDADVVFADHRRAITADYWFLRARRPPA
jgi:hypothetical protein